MSSCPTSGGRSNTGKSSERLTAVNTDLGTHPESVNAKPHETWMIKIRPTAAAEAESLLDAAAYSELVKT